MIENSDEYLSTWKPGIQTGARAYLELGCGRRKFTEDSLGVDRLPLTNDDGVKVPDYVWDLEKTPWPFARSMSCAFIIAHQTLEHLDNLIGVMNEIWRIADIESFVEIVVPYYKAIGAYQDPTHRRFFTEKTFVYWEPDFVTGFSDYGIRGFFSTAKIMWREDGNLYALLRPLKTEHDVKAFEEAKAEGRTWPRVAASLDVRVGEHNLLGGP